MKKIDLDRDFLCIKDFSKLVGITVESLRHYDRKGIFHPAKRGEGSQNEYRYYSTGQITTVKMVRVLTEIGVPLNVIKEYTSSRNTENALKLLSANKEKVANNIRFLQEVHAVINTFTELLNEAINANENVLTVCEMPEKRIIMGEPADFGNDIDFVRTFVEFCNTPREPHLNLSFPIGGFFKDMDYFLREPSRPTRFFSINPKGNETKAAGLYLTGYTRGYYGQTNDLPKRMEEYAKENGLIFNGPVYNIFVIDEIGEADPNQYLLQVSASVRETNRAPIHPLRRQFD